MKKYISAILIDAMLFQFTGCYTQKVITYDDFYNLPKEQEAAVITNDGNTIELTSDSLKNNYMYWKKEPDTLIVYSTHLKKVWSTALMEVTDTIHYPKEEITYLYVDEYDEVKTIVGIGVPVIIIIAIIIGLSTTDWVSLEGMNR